MSHLLYLVIDVFPSFLISLFRYVFSYLFISLVIDFSLSFLLPLFMYFVISVLR